MLGTDCPFSSKECRQSCALFDTISQQCNFNMMTRHLEKISKNLQEIEEIQEENKK